MRITFGIVRVILAFFAVLLAAGASVIAQASELSQELHHAAIHEAELGGHGERAAASALGDEPSNHQRPEMSGHTHCGASCHVQLSESRLAVAVAFAIVNAPYAANLDGPHASSHLGGLFRPPRA